MGESQKVEGPRTTVSWPGLIRCLGGRWTERHEFRLGRVNCQTILAESLRQDFHDALGIALVAKPNHEIIRIADEESTLTQARLHVLLEPKIQHVVQEHVRQQG